MKICPICNLKFDDQAEFCPKCHALLKECETADDSPESEGENKPQENEHLPKSFWSAVLWICGFIGVVYVFYMFLYGGFG